MHGEWGQEHLLLNFAVVVTAAALAAAAAVNIYFYACMHACMHAERLSVYRVWEGVVNELLFLLLLLLLLLLLHACMQRSSVCTEYGRQYLFL